MAAVCKRAGQLKKNSAGVSGSIDMVQMTPSDLVSSLLIKNSRGTVFYNILTFTSNVHQKNQKRRLVQVFF